MPNIKVIQGNFDTAKNQMSQVVVKMEKSLSEFALGVSAMEGQWRGGAANAYNSLCGRIQNLFEANIAQLKELGSDMETAQTSFENTDTTSANYFKE